MSDTTISHETQKLLESMEENGYNYDSMFRFVHNHGESDFKEHYEKYADLCENHSYQPVNAFIESFGVDYLENFEDSYYGEYESEDSFAEYFVEMIGIEIPDCIVVDWAATWNCKLCHDFVYEDGYVFSRNF